MYTGVNRMWITDSTSDILLDIDKINNKNGAKSIHTFDFSTLYTKINLTDLNNVLLSVLDKAFKGGTCQYIKISGAEAKFDKGKNKGISFTKQECAQMIEYIINNAYFCFGTRVYQQIVGIPMGTDPAPYIANLYLHFYESKWMEELAKTNFTAARRSYSHTRRFIDDLCALNNGDEIKGNWKNIYPKELILNLENESDTKATFLDLDIEIKNNQYVTKIFDKRDQFKFDIISYPDLTGNIPEKQAYGVCIGQVIRIARNTTLFSDFVNRVRTLLQKLQHKGYKKQLHKTLLKCFQRYDQIPNKYNTNSRTLVKLCQDGV